MTSLTYATEHYLLRPLTAADIGPDWGSWVAKPEIAKLLNADPRPLSAPDLADYLARFDNKNRILLGIFHKPSGRHIGIFTATSSDSGREVMWNLVVGEAAFRNVGGLLEIRKLRTALGNYFFFERNFQAGYASVTGHNKRMIAYLKAAGCELVKTSKVPSRNRPNGPAIDVQLFRITRQRYIERERSWARIASPETAKQKG